MLDVARLMAFLTWGLMTAACGGRSSSDGTSSDGSGSGGRTGQGNEPQPTLACSKPFPAPNVGPREDGPSPTTEACADISDSVILQRYDDREATVPRGFFYEPGNPNSNWGNSCAPSLAATLVTGAMRIAGGVAGGNTTPWFYEAVPCYNMVRYRELRCDYFDGSVLGSQATSEELAFLGSLLWWQSAHLRSGSAVLGSHSSFEADAEVVELCSIESVFGADLPRPVCDHIDVFSTRYVLRRGRVELRKSELVRTVTGDCD